jgi:hypothetical protein
MLLSGHLPTDPHKNHNDTVSHLCDHAQRMSTGHNGGLVYRGGAWCCGGDQCVARLVVCRPAYAQIELAIT